MKLLTEFPCPFREIENIWIPLSDGARLAARLWLPDGAEADPVPAILEYIPYRKGDGTAIDDSMRHRYFAGHGYAAIRVDIRGSGDSEGVLIDEYSPQEQRDAIEIIAWLAAQPWCSGRVGMIGISWGGFNALQVAAHDPPALGAVITLCSTDDRYSDDVHYIGGCVLAHDMLSWAMTLLAFNARPPDPGVVGERWREMWLERLDGTPTFVGAWLSHQRRDAYWKQGSVCEDFAAIRCPVLAVGGWADGYTNAVLRLLEGLSVPRRGIIGPWAHAWPQSGSPGPGIGFLQECLRWWDEWLKDEPRHVMDDPALRVWMQDFEHPDERGTDRAGRWVGVKDVPAETADHTLFLRGDTRLGSTPGETRELEISFDLAHGRDAGAWCPFGPADLAPDQGGEDAHSLTFDSAPLDEDTEVLGWPRVNLCLTTDRPSAQLAVRLCDVAPDGAALLVSSAVTNLSHSANHEGVEDLEPGRRLQLELQLNALGHRFRQGHRLRLALASSYWPTTWPAPEPVQLQIRTGETRLVLPVLPTERDSPAVRFDPPECAAPIGFEILRGPSTRREIQSEERTTHLTSLRHYDFGCVKYESEMETAGESTDRFFIDGESPTSASVSCRRVLTMRREQWDTRIEVEGEMRSERDGFLVHTSLRALESGEEVRARSWRLRIPRDGS